MIFPVIFSVLVALAMPDATMFPHRYAEKFQVPSTRALEKNHPKLFVRRIDARRILIAMR